MSASRKKGPGGKNAQSRPVSNVVLGSCYVASAAIVALCVMQYKTLTAEGDSQTALLYIFLAILGVLFSLFITWRQSSMKRKDSGRKSSDAERALRKKAGKR